MGYNNWNCKEKRNSEFKKIFNTHLVLKSVLHIVVVLIYFLNYRGHAITFISIKSSHYKNTKGPRLRCLSNLPKILYFEGDGGDFLGVCVRVCVRASSMRWISHFSSALGSCCRRLVLP